MNYFKRALVIGCALGLYLPSGQVLALGDQWYIGLGGGASWLQPNPEEQGIGLSDRQGTGGLVFVGRDIDDRSSGQLTAYSLGEATLKTDEAIPFSAVDGSVLYRFFDTKDRRIARGGMSLALYGRFALGYIDRDTETELTDDAAVYFGAGGGAEWFISNNISMRAEGFYHTSDAASGSLQLVARFGGVPKFRPAPRPTEQTAPEVPALPAQPAAPPEPTTPAPAVTPETSSIVDTDGDKVADADDQCPASTQGYPVRANGCALFDGVLSGVSFFGGTAELTADSFTQLDYLASVLVSFPDAKIELHSHTDNTGTVRDQAILTRARLKRLGTYLVGKGVSAKRLVLRSFGGTRPLYDNASADGRTANNRIEVLENR